MKKSNSIVAYFVDSFQELRKVTWPTKEETVKLTIVTLAFTLVFALVVGVIDLGFSQVFQWILTRGEA